MLKHSTGGSLCFIHCFLMFQMCLLWWWIRAYTLCKIYEICQLIFNDPIDNDLVMFCVYFRQFWGFSNIYLDIYFTYCFLCKTKSCISLSFSKHLVFQMKKVHEHRQNIWDPGFRQSFSISLYMNMLDDMHSSSISGLVTTQLSELRFKS